MSPDTTTPSQLQKIIAQELQYLQPSIPIQEISNLSHRDLAVGLIKCGTKQTAIISAYMDIKTNQLLISSKLP